MNSRFEEINDAFYNLNWEIFPDNAKRLMPIILHITQQPVHLESFGNVPCSRETFKKVRKHFFCLLGIFVQKSLNDMKLFWDGDGIRTKKDFFDKICFVWVSDDFTKILIKIDFERNVFTCCTSFGRDSEMSKYIAYGGQIRLDKDVLVQTQFSLESF